MPYGLAEIVGDAEVGREAMLADLGLIIAVREHSLKLSLQSHQRSLRLMCHAHAHAPSPVQPT